ncbi:hypothetical protein [Denitratisoma oestradiolicum]|uniref:hypothetical protein n=1 Tax=Denitratisoma oestradiolicum TaxID=311182 RepID=UPI001E5A3F2A|nr:hypothetical protein [Denitratisoma oestradiolicum]
MKAERARRDHADEARRTVEAELATQRADGARLTQRAADLERELEAHRERSAVALDQVRADLERVQEQGKADAAAARQEHAEALAALRKQHEGELVRLKDAHQQAMHEQKQRSVDVIGKLEASKQRMESELNAARKGGARGDGPTWPADRRAGCPCVPKSPPRRRRFAASRRRVISDGREDEDCLDG